MKEINEQMINRLWQSHSGLKSLKWNEIYDDEQELIYDMMKVNTDANQPSYKVVRGYEFISRFQNRINKGMELSDKQMTQLKRLASNIAFSRYAEK